MSHELETVGEFVLHRMSNMLLRPRMYAGSPEEFDAVLFVLDEIYSAYGNSKPVDTKYKRYVDYLREHGYGANTYCGFEREKNPDITNDELWSGLTNAWKDYLSELIDHEGRSGEQDRDAPA